MANPMGPPPEEVILFAEEIGEAFSQATLQDLQSKSAEPQLVAIMHALGCASAARLAVRRLEQAMKREGNVLGLDQFREALALIHERAENQVATEMAALGEVPRGDSDDDQAGFSGEVFSWETVAGLSSQFHDVTMGVTEQMGLPPFMHVLCLTFAAGAAEETFRRGLTEEDWEKYQKVRDLFMKSQRDAFAAARAERAKNGG